MIATRGQNRRTKARCALKHWQRGFTASASTLMSSITYNDIRQNRSNCFLKPTTLSYKKRAGETGLSWGTLLLVERQGGEAAVEDGIGAWLSFYNEERQHQSLGYHTPRQIYDEGLWICGRSALPTVCASPLPKPARKPGKCSPSPTSPQALPRTEGLIKGVLKVK